MCSIIKLLSVIEMKSSKQWIYSNVGFKKTPCVRVDSNCGCNFRVMLEMMTMQQTPLVLSSSINVDNIYTKVSGTVSSFVRACDTDLSHQNRTDDLDLVSPKFLKR